MWFFEFDDTDDTDILVCGQYVTVREVSWALAIHLRQNSAFCGSGWSPGYRLWGIDRFTVQVLHEGPDEAASLTTYADDLRAYGYRTSVQLVSDNSLRSHITVTRP